MSKHSKLPWIISKCALHQGHYDILSLTRLVTCVKGDNITDAQFIVTACNAYAGLKTKAELLDDLSRWTSHLIKLMALRSKTGREHETIKRTEEVLDRIKEL
jgi:hypothetical protein